MTDSVSLGSDRLSGLRWSPPERFDFARSMRTIPVTRFELVGLAHEGPVLLEGAGDAVQPVLFLSASDGREGPIGENGEWRRAYVPLALRMFPFVLENGEIRVALDPRGVRPDGAHAFPAAGDPPNGETARIVTQLETAWAEWPTMAAAAGMLAREIGIPWMLGEGDGDLRAVDRNRLSAFLRDGDWTDAPGGKRVPVLELAFASVFSVTRFMAGRARPVRPSDSSTQPEPANAPAATDLSADMPWLDLDGKIAF